MASLKNNIIMTNYDEICVNESQLCYVPLELLTKIVIQIGHFVHIKINDEKGIICQLMPVMPSFCKLGYQIIASCSVISGINHIRNFNYEKELNIDLGSISYLKVTNLLSLNITIIVDSIETVINSQSNYKAFKEEIILLLKLYKLFGNSVINCENNPAAKGACVSYIIINCIQFDDQRLSYKNCVGQMSDSTKVNILKVESKERHLYLIDNKIELGGLNCILKVLKEIVLDPWLFRGKFKEPGINYPSGVLLIGPPGCGKSSIVRQLCSETYACLVATSGAELLSPYQGETEKNLTKVAKKAMLLSKEGPCVFFIDEIDSICPIRSPELNTQDLRLTSQVLLTLDGCKNYPYLLVMAATNRPYAMDAASRRSGRLEIEILLNVPTSEERASILSIHTQDLLPENHSSIHAVALSTPGFVGADLKALCDKVREELRTSKEVDSNTGKNPEVVIGKILKFSRLIVPSIHKTLDFITTKPNCSNVGGLDNVKSKLDQFFFQHHKHAELYKLFRIKKPKGILLYGPRGCGKTRLVSLLASQRGFTFLSADASHLLSPYVGDSEKRIAALFHYARLAQPTIVFLDEIDGVFGSRENMSGVRISLLTELLQAMDGADVGATSLQGATQLGNKIQGFQDQVIVCAATNHPQALDSALLRPGRFDHIIYVPPPDKKARIDILKIKTAKLPVEGENVLERVADATKGWTGAEIEHLLSQAALHSLLEQKDGDDKILIIKEKILLKDLKRYSPSLTAEELNVFKEFENIYKNFQVS